ncbi:MAG: transposase [Candidatus Nomurabacteria bacterium]
MSIRKVSFAFGEYYHIYNRGNSKQTIFHDNEDYYHFIKLLFLSNTKSNFKLRNKSKNFFDSKQENKLVFVGCYCLMPNHFHLILSQTEEGSISKFMQKITTSYSMYYNQKYKRTGSLFEGKFKSEHVGDDRYLKYLFSYIHLNPVKLIQKDWKEIGIKNKEDTLVFLKEYKYSSYQDYSDISRKENIILDRKAFPDYFPNKDKFQREIFEWLSYNK